jgi:hypothetical protein
MERLVFLDAAVVVEHGPRAGVGEQAPASRRRGLARQR